MANAACGDGLGDKHDSEVIVASLLSLHERKTIIEIGANEGNSTFARGSFGEISVGFVNSGPGTDCSCKLSAIKSIHRVTTQSSGTSIRCGVKANSSVDSAYREQLDSAVLNEILALKLLNPHPCVVPLLYGPCADTRQSLLCALKLAFAYSPIDMEMVLRRRRKWCLPPMRFELVKSIARDLMLALQHCHERSIVHCDLKPGNLLVSSAGRIQLCDFGLARPYPSIDDSVVNIAREEVVVKGICSLYYRPPEVLLGRPFSKPSGDIFSASVVIAELLLGIPLFSGKNVVDQLGDVYELLGTPSERNWPDARSLPDYHKIKFSPSSPRPWGHIVPRSVESSGLEALLSKMATLDPQRRCTAQDALSSSWFLSPPHCLPKQLLAAELIPFELDPPAFIRHPSEGIEELLPRLTQAAIALADARRKFLCDKPWEELVICRTAENLCE